MSRTRQNRRPATIVDVAHRAGVAPMTASRALNNRGYVSAAKRAAVLAAAAHLRYAPNEAARALAGGAPLRIALLYSNPSASFFSEFLLGSLEEAARHHVQLVVSRCSDPAKARAIARELQSTGVGGVVLPPPLCEWSALRTRLLSARLGVVAVAGGLPSVSLPSVQIDNRAAARAMMLHILSLGHRRIGFIVGSPDQTAAAERTAGYRAALAEAGLGVDDRLIVQGDFSYRSGLAAAERLFDLSDRPTAIFASNDDMAAAAVSVARRRHLKVPRDVTICGFDDSEFSRSTWPELTTVRQPISDMARAALQLLVERLRTIPKASGNRPIASKTLDFELVIRSSDAPRRIAYRRRSRT